MNREKILPLHQIHLDLGAKMVPFAGFMMPLQYSSIKEEVQIVRKNLGLFDVGHMGEFWIRGPQASEFLDFIMTNDFANAPEGKAVYSPLCHEDGGIVDDVIAYKLGPEEVLLCVNASNIEKDWKHLNSHLEGFNCTLKNASEDTSLLALQGPQSETALKKMGLLSSDEDFPYYGVKKSSYGGENIILARTGYTGEDGVEVFCSNSLVPILWQEFLKNGAQPCGLAARDVLRLEVGYPLYGNDLDDHHTPFESNLAWAVKKKKARFVGKKALEEREKTYCMIRLVMDKRIPRAGYEVVDSQGQVFGKVTSGTLSPTTGEGIALARVLREKFPPQSQENGDKVELFIRARGQDFSAKVQKGPFVKGGHK